ncbi:hypothetical protein PVAND_014657 [Polypedilum vanderplanki]|uniref:Serpin domain-containing protein n=1 Tax=Polypedilum vanderplanki TaxID=319348 RepID=A0A9J6B9T9_POLVA|nr:hypothetical protein PVAND_014657 [Polypedilum vanderplanki]
MIKSKILIILLIVSCASFVTSQGYLDNGFVKALSSFAIRLYQEVTTSISDNVMLSPLSIQSILSLTMYGAKGDTKQAMFDTMTYSSFENMTYETVAMNFKELINGLEGSKAIFTAFKIYVTDLYNLSSDYQKIAIDYFSSEIESMSFRFEDTTPEKVAAYINSWVARKTKNRIQDLITPYSLKYLNTTRLILINTIYFKDTWTKLFTQANTKPGKFYISATKSVTANFMSLKSNFLYATLPELNATAITLSYKNSPMEMIILLPNARNGLKIMKNLLDIVDWTSENVTNRFQYSIVNLKIPKWKFEFSVDLGNFLKDMGMSLPFTEDADFTGMLDNYNENCTIRISKVVHKTFISVNENGTEASAATAVYMMGSGGPSKPKDFIADHPFIFMLRYNLNIYFIGQLTQF